jgi:peptide/nickel transport system permease protein
VSAATSATNPAVLVLPAQAAVRRRHRSIGMWLATGWLLVVTAVALLADLLPLEDPVGLTGQMNRSPGFRLDEPLGTDHLGRSILSRLVFGGRVSLTVCFVATLIALVGGVLLGLLAGYFRGWVDTVLDVLVNTMLAFPPLIFLIAITTIMEPSVTTLTISLGLLGIPLVVRVARAHTITIAKREYVSAARAGGVRTRRILLVEVLPNVLPSVLSFALVAAAALIVAEGSLSFLGLGIRPPTASWGGMIAESIPQLRTHRHEMLGPATVFFLTVLSLNTIGNWARARYEGGAR